MAVFNCSNTSSVWLYCVPMFTHIHTSRADLWLATNFWMTQLLMIIGTCFQHFVNKFLRYIQALSADHYIRIIIAIFTLRIGQICEDFKSFVPWKHPTIQYPGINCMVHKLLLCWVQVHCPRKTLIEHTYTLKYVILMLCLSIKL